MRIFEIFGRFFENFEFFKFFAKNFKVWKMTSKNTVGNIQTDMFVTKSRPQKAARMSKGGEVGRWAL